MATNTENNQMQNSAISTTDLERLLSETVSGLLFPSESDRPIEVVTSNNAAELKALFENQSASNETGVSVDIAFKNFYEKYGIEKEWQNSAQKEFASKFGSALRLLQENLSDVQVVRQGQVEITIFIAGRANNDEWVGLKTAAVETGE